MIQSLGKPLTPLLKTTGKVYLIPTTIATSTTQIGINHQAARDMLKGVVHFLAEDLRTARRFLKSVLLYDNPATLSIEILDKHTEETAIPEMMNPLKMGHSLGIFSKSGAPCIADPGTLAVRYAHRHNITVIPMVGPSSIVMALMASGLNGQQFSFHGYLSINSRERGHHIRTLEKESSVKQQTQLCIETPHRNNTLFRQFLTSLNPKTLLCVATDITGQNEAIKTLPVKEWILLDPFLPKKPTVFLFLSK